MKLDCGHEEDEGHPCQIRSKDGIKTEQGWTFALSLDGKRKLCHKCHTEEVLDCGHKIGEHSYISSGYGVDEKGNKHCYACCAKRDIEDMKKTGKAVLYLIIEEDNTSKGKVSNWPDSLSFPCYVKKGRHNMAGCRWDCWFNGPEGRRWHGTQYGNMSQICYCKRLKI